MDTYKLQDIMRFFLQQQAKGYQDINTLIEILRSEKLNPIRKKFTIISGLRECGLKSNESGETNQSGETVIGNFELTETVELIAYQKGKGQPVSCGLLTHKMDNGVLRFLVIYN